MLCIPKEMRSEFQRKVKSGEVDVLKLMDLSSPQRNAVFSDLFGKTVAEKVNALFESKMLLKDQQRGLITFIKTMTGIKPEVMRDMLTRVERLKEVLSEKEVDNFLNDLANQRLGFRVTMEQANTIVELASKVKELKADLSTPEKKLEYGASKVVFNKYVSDLKINAGKLTLKEQIKNPMKMISDIAGTAKSLKASMDNSAIFRQGWKVMMTNPSIWLKNARESFGNIAKTLKGEDVMDGLQAYFFSRENSLNGFDKQAKLDILSVVEESFPAPAIGKVPVIGRLYKASETAYTAFVQKTRADLFDYYINLAKKSGVELNAVELQSIGKLANSLTGRGHLGKLEPSAGLVNNVFFSPRLLKSNIDVLTAHMLQKGATPFVKKQAAVNLVKIVAGTSAVLTLANAVKPGSVEKDPRSSDFGKIRVGDTRFEVSGGMSSIITLASRLATMSSKSSVTGKVTDLNTGEFGGQTGADVVYNFFENKLSPASAVVKDLLKGQDFQGNKITLLNEANNMFTPLPITNYVELRDNPNSADTLLATLADVLGISVNTYSITTNWNNSTSQEMTQFRQKVGDKKFAEANKAFNDEFATWFAGVISDPRYTKLTADEQSRVITNKKNQLQDQVLRKYGFVYKKLPSKPLPKF